MVRRGVSTFLSKVDVRDDDESRIGGFKQKSSSLGRAFRVLGPDDEEVCSLKGKRTGWDFRLVSGDREFAHVSKKWGGLGKELLTSADKYVLEVSDDAPADNPIRQLIIAVVMCINRVLKE